MRRPLRGGAEHQAADPVALSAIAKRQTWIARTLAGESALPGGALMLPSPRSLAHVPVREGSAMDFTGKVAVVTGGANGIGRAVSLDFARRGAKVVVVDRDAEAGAAVAAEIGKAAIFRAADVTRSADVQAYVQAALDAFGAIDCFHNNAGIEGRVAPTAEYDEAAFDAVMGVNVKGVFSVCATCCRSWYGKGAGRW
jgi:NADPH-dependent 2,4-dienoyl-CoA reductase/sulfur reductase-like enzyme